MPRRLRIPASIKPKTAGPEPRTKAKAVVKRCVAGHRQTPLWKPHQGCMTCAVRAREREDAVREIGPAPAFLSIRTVDTGKTRYFAIPPHLQRRRPPRRARV